MTILIGYKFPNGVTITADTKSSDIDKDGNVLGSSHAKKKIKSIRPNIIIATAGLGDLGSATVDLIHSLINHKDYVSVEDAVIYTQRCFQFTFQTFKDINPEVNYNLMYTILGGYDPDKKTSFLYELKSTNNFEFNGENRDSSIIGDGQTEVASYISSRLRTYSPENFYKLFAEAIRSIDNVSVSKETQTIFSFYENNSPYISEKNLDKNGHII
ncbi:hypothetical protein QCI44_28815 [Bacillus cereus group sp. RP37]|uniref:hypothetical protein n=1 Tax=Bacillus cereus group sp. RP37 TaxID=3040259 RepID=UPI00086ED9CE|nr:Uncharacterized protein BCRIVMBC845_02413 [Bacillus cereus]